MTSVWNKTVAGIGFLGALWLAGCSPDKPPPNPPAPDPLVVVTNQSLDVHQRKQALTTLLKTPEGAQQVLRYATGGRLPPDLRLMAGLELAHLPWPELAIKGMEIFAPPCGQDNRPLPRLAELSARPGNAANGEKVFRRPEVNCIGCHVVHGEGVKLGSDLSDIGTKMDKETLLENLLDPSAVITQGYETWQIILQNDDELFGVLAAETADELAIRDAKNNLSKVKKADIKIRRQVPVSLMPVGLQQTMPLEDLVDLVEYLSSLKH